jgi:hypothetical protein
MTTNPYATTSLESGDPAALPGSADRASLMEILRQTFLAWERLRIVYIALLALLTLLLAGQNLLRIQTLVMIVEGAIVANVCFFAGPITESYIHWLGYEGKWVRWFLFIAGTFLTAILAIAGFATVFLPNQN